MGRGGGGDREKGEVRGREGGGRRTGGERRGREREY